MPRLPTLALGLLVLSTSVASAQGRRGAPEATQYGWGGSLEAGQDEARRTGKPLMVVLRCVP